MRPCKHLAARVWQLLKPAGFGSLLSSASASIRCTDGRKRDVPEMVAMADPSSNSGSP